MADLDIRWTMEGDVLVGQASVPGDRELRLAADLDALDLTEEEAKRQIRAIMEAEIA